jgi:Short C-terminal domain
MYLADELAKLNQLRKDGALSEEEFAEQKRILIEGNHSTKNINRPSKIKWVDVPLRHKLWFHFLLGLLVVPVGLLMMMIYPSYTKNKAGDAVRESKTKKIIFGMLFVTSWILYLGNMGTNHSTNEKTTSEHSSHDTESMDILPECDSQEVEENIGDIISNSPANKLINLELVEFTSARQVSYTKNTERRCVADVVLNSGREQIQIRLTPAKEAGTFLIEVDGMQ